jgi:hypothetical protein
MPKPLSIHSNSLAIAREIKDRQSEGAALVNFWELCLQQQLAIAREIKDRQREGLGNLRPKPLSIHSNSLAIAREIKDRQSEGEALAIWDSLTALWATRPKPLSIHSNS